MSDSWKDAHLLLVGHGTARVEAGDGAVRRVAHALRDKGLFASVQAAFWREEPKVTAALFGPGLNYVVPLFAGHGKHTDTLIPEALGLSGPVTRRGGRTVVYCPPVGTHPRIPALIEHHASIVCEENGVAPAKAALLLIAHGSQSSEGRSSATPEAVGGTIRDRDIFAQVAVSYLEQTPYVRDWATAIEACDVIAMPLLLSDGMHVNDDLPPLFGLNGPAGGPAMVGKHRVWLTGGIADDAVLEAMTLDLIRLAEAL